MTEKTYIGLYSAEADQLCGHYIYARENGEHVKVTEVLSQESSFETNKWSDKEMRGPVVRFISSHTKSKPIYDQVRQDFDVHPPEIPYPARKPVNLEKDFFGPKD